jgi:ribosomal protein S27E
MTIKTWEERYRDNFKGNEDARRQIAIAQHEEIADLRAALVKVDCKNCVHLSARDSAYDIECLGCSHYYASKFEAMKGETP